MEPPILTLKGSVFNALFPTYAKNILWALVILFPFFGGAYVLGHMGVGPSTAVVLSTYFVLVAFGALVPLVWRIIVIVNTTYTFYHDLVVMEFRFFVVKQESVPYAKITNITVAVSIWDRITGGGDITVHTADDSQPNLVLYSVPRPRELHDRLRELVAGPVHPSGHARSQHK
jgi:uncharacterized membrane protein YdbT with pleckstrin-like domain